MVSGAVVVVGWAKGGEDGKGKRERGGGCGGVGGGEEVKKAQLMTSSYASVHLLMSFQGEAGRAAARLSRDVRGLGHHFPAVIPAFPLTKSPGSQPLMSVRGRVQTHVHLPAFRAQPAARRSVGVRHIPELLIIYIILISSPRDTLT